MSDATPRSRAPETWSSPVEGLPLLHATPEAWIDVALSDLPGLLVDHAHCEHKAASAALAMLGRFADKGALLRPLMALAQEEIHHFRQVLDLIEGRGAEMRRPKPDRYVKELRDRAFRLTGGLGALGDLLLVNAFVEARSCERFRLLARGLADPTRERPEDHASLSAFYRRLADAEGRHWELFRDLALTECAREAVERRLGEFARVEAEIVASRPLEPRMH